MRKLTAPPYKTDNGHWFTLALFYEMVIEKPLDYKVIEPIFTLYDEKPGYICARKTFVELGDPTGYSWAMKYLGDYAHWVKLCKAKWFQEAVEIWRTELAVKQEAEAIAVIREIAAAPGKSQMPAARFLAEMNKPKSGRGRPSKEELAAQLKREAQHRSVEDEDYDRIANVVPLRVGGSG